MGDIFSPKRRDVVERLRRRFEFYRRRQNGVQQRYEFGQKAIYEQERQHALLLRQKWLESKAKKSSKSKTKTDNNHPDHRNQIVTKRLKHKLDGNAVDAQNQNHPENVYRFEDDDAPPAKKISSSSSTSIDGLSSNVSVHIVHQINGVSSQQEPKISTNVTVNQTIKSQTETESETNSNVECKKEPSEDSVNKSNANNNNSDLDSEFNEILNTFDKFNDEDIPENIIDELNRFDEIYSRLKDSDGNETSLNTSDSSSSMFASNMYDPSQGPGQVRTPPFRSAQPHAAPQSSMAEGGLAAETLKQMAAQHQQHHPNAEQFRVKSAIDPFSDLSETGHYGSRNGYSADYYGDMPRSGSAGSFTGQQPGMGYPSKQGMTGYSAPNNKLTQYAHNVPSSQAETGPSSLQQLQNQVAHFNQGPQMEITQTQHMQVSDGSHRMQMSQTQHVQLRQPLQNISLTQQQGFSSSPNMVPNPSQSQTFMGSEQLTMQQQQQQQQQMMQSKMHPDQRAHMQQYMNRPPPEYKMQHANGMSSGSMQSNGMGPNPLQTIQNMVNQTNTHQNTAYSSVKSESNDMQNGMRTAQMTAMQQQMGGSGIAMSMSQAQLSYNSNQSVQRQVSFPGALPPQAMSGRPQRPNAPTYTSAIMRNQRPPNVNIGPDGLNISQPRHPQEWPRNMNPMAAGQPTRGVAPVTSANMMHYRSYTADGHMASAAQMQQMHHQGQRTMHMESQQQAMVHANAHAQQQIMMQQQRIHMSQQMPQQNIHTSQTPPYSSQTPSSYPQTSNSQDDILNLLDTAPNQSTDFFDVQTSSGGTEANWYDIEDILGNPK